jgi:hypothetical protein
LGVDPPAEEAEDAKEDEDISVDDDARSDGVALKLLPRPGATLLTILGPSTLAFLSSLPTKPTATPLPTLANEQVDKLASETDPIIGFKVSSELRGDPARG